MGEVIALSGVEEPSPRAWRFFVHKFARGNNDRTTIASDVVQIALDLELDAFKVRRSAFVTRSRPAELHRALLQHGGVDAGDCARVREDAG
jgi:hypothetical protein